MARCAIAELAPDFVAGREAQVWLVCVKDIATQHWDFDFLEQSRGLENVLSM